MSTPMTLEQMQKQGRAKMNRPAHGICFEQEDILDQHTANTWKAALNSILESGMLEEKEMINDSSMPDHVNDMINNGVDGHNTLARAVKEFISNMDKV